MKIFGRRRERREADLIELEVARVKARMVDEDVTLFGEQLSDLHVETLTTELDADMRADYQRALDLYDEAKRLFHRGASDADLIAVGSLLEEGRFHRACLLARRDGEPLPERLPPCFFNPQHGPSLKEVAWAPAGGVERAVPVCRADLNRLERDLMPEMRVVRLGNHYVPWFAAGTVYEELAGTIDQRAIREGQRQAMSDYTQWVGPAVNIDVFWT